MAIRVQRHTNVSKQATLLDGLDFSRLKWRICGCGLNQFVHEGMNHISNAKVHLKNRSGNVNISLCHTSHYSLYRKIGSCWQKTVVYVYWTRKQHMFYSDLKQICFIRS